MPHVIVKMLSGRSDQVKQRLADQILKDVTGILNIGDDSVLASATNSLSTSQHCPVVGRAKRKALRLKAASRW